MRHKANRGRVLSDVGYVPKKGYYAVFASPTVAPGVQLCRYGTGVTMS